MVHVLRDDMWPVTGSWFAGSREEELRMKVSKKTRGTWRLECIENKRQKTMSGIFPVQRSI